MLSNIQKDIASLLAKNRSAENYFAGGAVLNARTWRVSEDLDIFTDRDEIIPDIVQRDIAALKQARFQVVIDLEIYGCTEATVRKSGEVTQIQWMSESSSRFFPLQADPDWGLRLHMTDLAVNKVLAASTRRQARDALDLALIADRYCALGPLFLGAAHKLPKLSPLRLIDQARHRIVTTPLEAFAAVSGRPEEVTPAFIKEIGLNALDDAEAFLEAAPDDWLEGIPIDAAGVPVNDQDQIAEIRRLSDGGGCFPSFPGLDFAP
jgi:hypothetical protein